jgi:hypothetical protein
MEIAKNSGWKFCRREVSEWDSLFQVIVLWVAGLEFRRHGEIAVARTHAATTAPLPNRRKSLKTRLTSVAAGGKSFAMNSTQKQFSLNRAASKSKFLSV